MTDLNAHSHKGFRTFLFATTRVRNRTESTFRAPPRTAMRILQQKLWKTLLKSRLEPVIRPHQLGRSSDLHHPGAYKKQNTKAPKQSERSVQPAPVYYTSQVKPTLSHKKLTL